MSAQRVDTLGMWDAFAGLPDQVEAAVAAAQAVDGLPDPKGITNVLVLGMGGSGIAGDFLTVTAGPFMSLPVVVVKNYTTPSYVSESTLVMAVSASGNTAETIEATITAASLGGQVVAVTGGGRLGELAGSWGAPVIPVDPTIPMPRAGLGAVGIPPLVVLERMGFFPGAGEWIGLAVEQLRRRGAELTGPASPALDLARRIGRTLPIIYGGGGTGDVAARRWKTQINENAKVPAFSNTVPELCHNEVVGWGQHGDVTRQVFSLVFLRHDDEHPAVGETFAVLSEMIGEVVSDIHEVEAGGDGVIAQVLDMMMFGDAVSLEMAGLEGIDPGPIPAIAELKSRLEGLV